MATRHDQASSRSELPRPPLFLPIKPDLLKTDTPLEFGLYASSAMAGRVLIKEPGLPLSRADHQNLVLNQAEAFILRTDLGKFRAFREAQVRELIGSPQADPETMADLAYDLSLTVIETTMEDPQPENIAQATQSLQTTADLIMAKDQALTSLLQKTKNSPKLHIHSCNVAIFGLGLAKGVRKDRAELNLSLLTPALFFHDLGHTITARNISDKPGPLTPLDWARIEGHVTIGRALLAESGIAGPEVDSVLLHHHERLDGSGFPDQLQGDQIGLPARICAIADMYDALTTDLDAQRQLDPMAAARMMLEEMKGHFDRDLLRRFFEMFKRSGG